MLFGFQMTSSVSGVGLGPKVSIFCDFVGLGLGPEGFGNAVEDEGLGEGSERAEGMSAVRSG